ncbi:6-chlorohydroxyquinol 1,2-dioxygenase [Pararobbsia alpina]|uniref:intradiol ring-cleavage dioxygenase n=1 Tax=Pararobbsia alpina TaxID=621374 RepID=UPI0039A5CD68
MRNLDETTITDAVLARHEGQKSTRLGTIMTSLVRHLHAFAREVELTEAEWEAGIRFLTEAGNITDDKRQEFILLSDTLGLSMLVTAMASRKPQGCTEATVFGPFFVSDAPAYENGADVANGAPGKPCFVSGRIVGLDGQPVANAQIEVWQADEDGFYDVQYRDLASHRARGVLCSLSDGRYFFRTIVAEPYPIPHDGPVGKMLAALDRHPWRPAHLHFMITAPGYERLVTHVFREGDRYLDSDAVFGVRSSLIADWIEHPAGVAPDGTTLDEPFCTLAFDFVLNPAP